jgi:hypothetical protein
MLGGLKGIRMEEENINKSVSAVALRGQHIHTDVKPFQQENTSLPILRQFFFFFR